MIGSVSPPGRLTAMPSAMVCPIGTSIDLAGFQALFDRGGIFRLDADDAHVRHQGFYRGGDAGNYPAAADRHDYDR